HVDAPPARAAVAGEVGAHRQPEDLIRAGSELAGAGGIQGDVRLALRAALIRDVHVAGGCRRGASAAAQRSVCREIQVLVPPSWGAWAAPRLHGREGLRGRGRLRKLVTRDGDKTHGEREVAGTDHRSLPRAARFEAQLLLSPAIPPARGAVKGPAAIQAF